MYSYVVELLYEYNVYSILFMGAKRILKSACSSTQCEQSLHCPHELKFASLAIKTAPREDFDQTARMSECTFSDIEVQISGAE